LGAVLDASFQGKLARPRLPERGAEALRHGRSAGRLRPAGDCDDYSGRPTKLEGNPDHPVTQGRSDIFMQAAVLGLYDPDRAQGPTRRGEPVSWNDVADHIGALRAEWGRTRGEGLRLLTGPVTSPTLSRQLDTLLKQFPKARIHTHEPVGNGGRRN
jgi:molybdopterin-containing oxidoreductase family iron-sulfur binding subunit